MKKFFALLLPFTFIFCPFSLFADQDYAMNHWKKVLSDPKAAVEQDIPKQVINGSNEQLVKIVKNEAFKKHMLDWKEKKFNIPRDSKRPMQGNDTPSSFFSDTFVSTLEGIPVNGATEEVPWSSDYWAIRRGILSVRYCSNDKNTANRNWTWKQSINAYKQPDEHKKLYSNLGEFEKYVAEYYSPAEKYDLLVGDTDYTLTNEMKNAGSRYADSKGDVEGWMGICHGWAPAAFMVPRPTNMVTILGADGKTNIVFYADDIRALSALKWAESSYSQVFVGGRCNSKDSDIKKDKDTSVITDYTCFDTNPATWHMIIGNQIGLRKKSFVMDATYDYEVWNQPVYNYSVQYFNPLKSDWASNNELAKAKVPFAEIKKSDKAFLKFVSKNANKDTDSIVGVSMDVVYIAETNPVHKGSPSPDRQVRVTYVYVLELDKNGAIIGGEWTQNKHPDFVWSPSPDAKALNSEDQKVGSIDGTPDSFKGVTKYAKSASSRGDLLYPVLDILIDKAK